MGPKVSVCIPTYNRAGYLGGAIASVLEQTMQDFEIIVYDDASTDTTAAVVRGFQEPRIRYFRQVQRVGISRNRNSCLAVARGEYIGWLDSDDLYLPHMLKQQSAVLDAHPAVGLVHGEVEWIDEGGAAVGMPAPKFPPEGDTIEPGLAAFRELCASNYIVVPTVLVRRACYEEVGGYNPALQVAEDSEMWLRIALRYDLAFRTGAIARKRVHTGSIGRSLDMARLVSNRVRSIAGIFAGAPRGHAGVRALHELATAGRLFQVYWHLRALFDARASRRALVLLTAQAPLLRRRTVLKRSYWELYRPMLRGDDIQFDRSWRALIESPLLAIRDTRQGRFVLEQYFPGLWTITRLLLADATQRHYRPGGLQGELEDLASLLESAGTEGCLVFALPGRHVVMSRKNGQWRIVQEGDLYQPTTPFAANAFLEQLQAEGMDFVMVPRTPAPVDGQPPLFAYLERHLVVARDTNRWTVYDLSSFTGRLKEVAEVRHAVADTLPPGASVLVVSKGDDDLLSFPRVRAQHFPQTASGGYAGYNPSDGMEALRHLEALRSQGAQYLLFPHSAFWWLDYYAELKAYLAHCELLVSDAACRLYRLVPAEVPA